MTVWQVWDGDYEGCWVVATYISEALAKEHVAACPRSRYSVDSTEVLSALDPDVVASLARRKARQEKARRNSENQT